MESFLSIDEVVRRTGLTAHTLRYYERIGLIARVGRAAGGQRRYAASDMAWIEFLLRLRTTRMPIGKMLEFARLRGAGDSSVAHRRRMLEAHLSNVLAEIQTMRQSAEALRLKIAHYHALEQTTAPSLPSPKGHTDEHGQSLRTRTRKAAGN